MSKSISGEGSIRKRLTGKLAGKWRVQWSYDDPMTSELVSVDRTFPTQGQAATFLKELKAKVHTGQKIEEANAKRALTLNAWFDELAGTAENGFAGRWSEDGMKPLTIAAKVSRFNSNVRSSEIGPIPLQHLDVDRARSFFRAMKEDGKSKATLKDVQAVLVKVLNDAIDTYEKLPNLRNPFRKVRLESPEPREAIAVTPESAMKAIRSLANPDDRAFLGLYFLAGLRLSEQMALTSEQIDFEKGVIVVDRAVKLGPTGRQEIGMPKGDKARLVAMCPTLAELLKPLAKDHVGYLFHAESADKPKMKKVVYSTWKRILKESGLPEDLELRDCRLSHNTWIEKFTKVSLSTRLEHMGHSVSRNNSEHKGLTVNVRNYTRFLSGAQDILRKELERVVKAAEPKRPPTAGAQPKVGSANKRSSAPSTSL